MDFNLSERSLVAPHVRFNGVCPYFTMFKLSVPVAILRRHPDATTVLDPFCGRGTSLYAARLFGKRGVGIDLNPVAAAVSKAKVAAINIERVTALLGRALEARPSDIPQGEFWERCFHPKTLESICAIREFLRSARGDSAAVLRAIVLGSLHGPLTRAGSYLSNQMPRTYATKPDAAIRFWRRHRLRPRRIDVWATVSRRIQYLLPGVPAGPGGRVLRGDALRLLPEMGRAADLVVTSPPYMGLRTYLPDQWLRFWFLGGAPEVVYDLPGQLGIESEERFVGLLAGFFAGIDKATTPTAHAYVLLGSIPSRPANVPKIMTSALQESGAPWRVISRRSQGRASAGKRQAVQFSKYSCPAEEHLYHLAKRE